MATKQGTTVNIRPDVAILSVLRHLNYRPWYAIAEFVDNSLDSFLKTRKDIKASEGATPFLVVQIEIDSSEDGRIVVRDNAGGIAANDYARAFRAAEAPPDKSGLSEFGMGMKSAACWFGRVFTVRSSALGESVERTVRFDVERIVRDKTDALDVHERRVPAETHYTEIVIEKLYQPPQGRTLGKIKDHLESIYRVFLRDGNLELRFGDDAPLHYDEPDILQAPHFKHETGQQISWRKDIDLRLGHGLRAHGFAALRKTGSTSTAGFALFRRNRLIQGSVDETYRPKEIFEDPNGFIYQRLFGELHLEGFAVSHTKDGFRWDENEEPFLTALREALNAKPLAVLDQARGYRVRPKTAELKSGAEEAVKSTAHAIQHRVPSVLEQQLRQPPAGDPPATLPRAARASQRVTELELHGYTWRITLELTNDPAVGDWLTVNLNPLAQQDSKRRGVRNLGVRVSLAHPFMQRFGGTDASRIEPLLRVATAIALAETAAREAGVKRAGTVRRNVNELLREALSRAD